MGAGAGRGRCAVTAPWQRQSLTREQVAQAREWLQKDPWAYWACMAAWTRVTYGQDWLWYLADLLRQHREQQRQDVPADEALLTWAQGQPPD